MKTNEQKIKDLGTKLNMAATNKEYQILKDQIDADTMANSVLEDEILEMMDQFDTFAPKIAEAEKDAQDDARETRRRARRSQAAGAAIQGDIERLEGELVAFESELPEEIRENVRRLARSQGEDALAEVVEGACGGCYQQVPVNVQANIRMSRPSFCLSCGRLLYFSEEK